MYICAHTHAFVYLSQHPHNPNPPPLGVPMFLVLLALVSWVTLVGHEARAISSSAVTFIALCTLAFWLLITKHKWDNLLKVGEVSWVILCNVLLA